MLVHVIKPNGTRHEYPFREGTPDATILQQLAAGRRLFGRTATTFRPNPDTGETVEHDDPAAPWAWDSPDLTVVVGEVVGDRFVERRRLRGPAPAAAAQEAV